MKDALSCNQLPWKNSVLPSPRSSLEEPRFVTSSRLEPNPTDQPDRFSADQPSVCTPNKCKITGDFPV